MNTNTTNGKKKTACKVWITVALLVIVVVSAPIIVDAKRRHVGFTGTRLPSQPANSATTPRDAKYQKFADIARDIKDLKGTEGPRFERLLVDFRAAIEAESQDALLFADSVYSTPQSSRSDLLMAIYIEGNLAPDKLAGRFPALVNKNSDASLARAAVNLLFTKGNGVALKRLLLSIDSNSSATDADLKMLSSREGVIEPSAFWNSEPILFKNEFYVPLRYITGNSFKRSVDEMLRDGDAGDFNVLWLPKTVRKDQVRRAGLHGGNSRRAELLAVISNAFNDHFGRDQALPAELRTAVSIAKEELLKLGEKPQLGSFEEGFLLEKAQLLLQAE